MINWDAVATAGATAVFVTLTIEYIAKPRLECRKERILAMVHSRQELLSSVVDLSMAAGVVKLEAPPAMAVETQGRVEAERQRQYGRIREQSERLFDQAGKYAGAYALPHVMRDIVIGYIYCVQGVALSARSQRQQAETIYNLGIPMAGILDHPRFWQVRKWQRGLEEVRRLILETES
jgi:hypothetical protein